MTTPKPQISATAISLNELANQRDILNRKVTAALQAKLAWEEEMRNLIIQREQVEGAMVILQALANLPNLDNSKGSFRSMNWNDRFIKR